MVVSGDELRAMTGGTLASPATPTGTHSFEAWLAAHGSGLGRRWVRRTTRH